MPDDLKPLTHSLIKTDQEVQNQLDPRYAGLYQAVRDAYKKENASSLSLWMSVQAELRRYGLERACPPSTVLHSSFLRGVRAIDNGKEIPNPGAWLRLTCRNIIKEKSRGRKKEAQFETIDLLPEQVDEGDESDNSLCARHQKVNQIFQRLLEIDQTILTLKVINGLRWDAVQIRLMEMGYKKYSLGALRKRKSRAFQQLRDDYQAH